MTTAADRLKTHGLQITAQRLALVEAIASSPHATADELADAVRSRIGSVSRQAIYGSLGAMVDKGMVRQIQPAGSPARYEDRIDDNHHHLICRECGVTIDIDCVVGSAPCLTAEDNHGFEIDEAEVIHWGTCPECRQIRTTSQRHG